jgi:hypothetical protein
MVYCSGIDILKYSCNTWNSDGAIYRGTSYELVGRRATVQVLVKVRLFSPPYLPDWFWGPPSQWVQKALSVGLKLITHL